MMSVGRGTTLWKTLQLQQCSETPPQRGGGTRHQVPAYAPPLPRQARKRLAEPQRPPTAIAGSGRVRRNPLNESLCKAQEFTLFLQAGWR